MVPMPRIFRLNSSILFNYEDFQNITWNCKKGSSVILMRNLSLPRFCKETDMIVEELIDNLIITSNVIIIILRITIKLSEGKDIPLKQSQFLIQLCFFMTIRKAQGQTTENILVYLERPAFQHG